MTIPVLLFWQTLAYKGWGKYARDLIVGTHHDNRIQVYSGFPIDDDTIDYQQYHTAYEMSQRFFDTITTYHHKQKYIKYPDIICYTFFNGYTQAIVKQSHIITNTIPISKKAVNIGFYEDGYMQKDYIKPHLEKLQIVGSQWNRELLESLGFQNVCLHIQGVDDKIFHQSAQQKKIYHDYFTIYSGGVLSARKSFDIIAKVFAIFSQKYPDTLLIANWPFAHMDVPCQDMATISQDINFNTMIYNSYLDYHKYFAHYGIKEDNYILLPHLTAKQIAYYMQQSDIALFPNRCEGGTNRVAMEAMACGLPVIISNNTGHQDIIHDKMNLVLRQQTPINFSPYTIKDASMWHESDIDEIIAHLEFAYHNRDKIKQEGVANASFMKQYNMTTQGKIFADIISENF